LIAKTLNFDCALPAANQRHPVIPAVNRSRAGLICPKGEWIPRASISSHGPGPAARPEQCWRNSGRFKWEVRPDDDRFHHPEFVSIPVRPPWCFVHSACSAAQIVPYSAFLLGGVFLSVGPLSECSRQFSLLLLRCWSTSARSRWLIRCDMPGSTRRSDGGHSPGLLRVALLSGGVCPRLFLLSAAGSILKTRQWPCLAPVRSAMTPTVRIASISSRLLLPFDWLSVLLRCRIGAIWCLARRDVFSVDIVQPVMMPDQALIREVQNSPADRDPQPEPTRLDDPDDDDDNRLMCPSASLSWC